MTRLGAIAQQLSGGEIYQALEKGTIDAAEWVGPYDDEKLGFNKVAPHYYYPGWWESNSMYSFYVNTKVWESLPKDYQAAFEAAAAEANIDMMAGYDFKNPPALRRLVGSGTKLHAYPVEMMKAAQNAAFDLYEEEAARNPAFKKMYEPWKKFRGDVMLWHRFAENTYSNFVLNNAPSKSCGHLSLPINFPSWRHAPSVRRRPRAVTARHPAALPPPRLSACSRPS